MRCPYTGLQFILEYHHEPGTRREFWRARGLFDPCQWFESEEAARDALSVRNGEKRVFKRLRCPYTGRPVSFVRNDRLGKVRATGVFDPLQLFPSREAAAYALATRNGKKPVGLPEKPPKIAVTELEAPLPSTCDDLGHVADKAKEQIEELLLGE